MTGWAVGSRWWWPDGPCTNVFYEPVPRRQWSGSFTFWSEWMSANFRKTCAEYIHCSCEIDYFLGCPFFFWIHEARSFTTFHVLFIVFADFACFFVFFFNYYYFFFFHFTFSCRFINFGFYQFHTWRIANYEVFTRVKRIPFLQLSP